MSDKVINKLFVCLFTIIFLFNNITIKTFQAFKIYLIILSLKKLKKLIFLFTMA